MEGGTVSRARPNLLVVDDKKNMTRLVSKVMGVDTHVYTAESGVAAVEALTHLDIQVVLCDLKMPDMDGLEVLRACRDLRPGAQFVLMTAYASVGTAIEAMKLGAYDYLTKPFDPDLARGVILAAASRSQSSAPGRSTQEVLPGVIASSRIMVELGEFIRRVADSEVTSLLLGETGTGKERLARALHELSPRAGERFVAVNCAAIPAELLESELFGSAKGAFTGATAARRGLFEEAHLGSLFLDEIGDMRPSLQAKLTRALEERAVRRVGEAKERPVDVRVIAATHRDLESMVRARAFREDLWYRLNVAVVRIPPLRERAGDVEVLAHHFLSQHAERSRGPQVTGYSDEALDALSRFDWPGNVRQLRSAVERACVVADGLEIQADDLPPELFRRALGVDEEHEMAELTWSQAMDRGRTEVGRNYLEQLMTRFEGQVTDAAEHAGVERESFYRLLRKHGIDAAAYRGSRKRK